jgi:hypothetical protein
MKLKKDTKVNKKMKREVWIPEGNIIPTHLFLRHPKSCNKQI